MTCKFFLIFGLKNNFPWNILHVNIFNSGGGGYEEGDRDCDKEKVGGEMETVVREALVERVVVVKEQKW
jgi:hypothetical protein